jgi:hypothetical protein
MVKIMFWKSNSKGFGIVEVLIATGLTVILGYAITTILMNSTKGLTTTRTTMEAQDQFVVIKSFLAESGNCGASFGSIGVDPSTGWVSSGSFSLKTTTGTSMFAVGTNFGIGNAVHIRGYRIKEKSPDFIAANHRAMLYVQFSRKENSYVRDFENETPLWITPTSGQITDCRSIMNDDQIWKRSLTDMTNIFYDGLNQSSAGLGTVAMGIENAAIPATVHIHRGGGDSVLGITSSPGGSGKADIMFCSNLPTGATNIQNCSADTWTINTSTFGLKLKTVSGGALAASFHFDSSSDSLLTIPQIAGGAESGEKGVRIYEKGILIANRPGTEGSFATNKSCSASFGGDPAGSCNNAAGAFYTADGFALGTAFGYNAGTPNGWVGGAPGILAGENITGGSAGAFQIHGKGMFIAESSTLIDVINCYNTFDETIIEQPDSTACSRATGGFFGRAGFAVGTGTGGLGFVIGLPGMVGGKTVTGGTTNSFKVTGLGVMLAEQGDLAAVESCYQSTIPGVAPPSVNPCATATGGFFGKWGFAVGSGSLGAGYIWGRAGAISGEHQIGGTAGAFSLAGNGLFIAADGSNLTNLYSCYSALAGDVTASCVGAAGAFLGRYGMALGSDTGPYVVLNPTKLELRADTTNYVQLLADGNIDLSGEVTAASDRSLKKQIVPLAKHDFLEKLLELNPVSYQFKADEKQKTHFGFIAQELREIFPNLIRQDEKTGILSLNYMGLIAPIVSAIQELFEQFNDFAKQQRQMQDQLEAQDKKIIELQNKLNLLLQQKNQCTEVIK